MPPKQSYGTCDSCMVDVGGSSPLSDTQTRKIAVEKAKDEDSKEVSNVYVLNVAFYSFVGFLIVQVVFALIAHSQAMLADSEAMAVDAMTYLFNLAAERLKHRLPQDHEHEVKCKLLELIPPLISVVTLLIVTVSTTKEALGTLGWLGYESEDDEDEDVSITIMLVFSSANLLLDIVNVTCFARAHSAFGVLDDWQRPAGLQGHEREHELLLQEGNSEGKIDDDEVSLNLNMCSAWTHVCADTMRSTAVVIAAGLACLFPVLEGDKVDAVAAVVVSVIIVVSLMPLAHGLCRTTSDLRRLLRDHVEPSRTIDV